MLTTSKWVGLLAVAFVAGSFVASPELRAFAANTVGSADIIDESILSADIKNGEVKTADLGANSVTAAKIKDGEVKAAEIATDAVGAAEIQGVTKLLFARCNADSAAGSGGSAGANIGVICNITGVDANDNVIATLEAGSVLNSFCFVVQKAIPGSNRVEVRLTNVCGSPALLETGVSISIIVYDK